MKKFVGKARAIMSGELPNYLILLIFHVSAKFHKSAWGANFLLMS